MLPFWKQVALGAFTVLTFAIFVGFVSVVVAVLVDGLGHEWRTTVGSWWADRHARGLRREIARLHADDVEREREDERDRRRLQAVAELRRLR